MMRVGPPQAHFVACPKLLVGFGPLSMSRRCHFARADRGPMLHLQTKTASGSGSRMCRTWISRTWNEMWYVLEMVLQFNAMVHRT